MPQIVTEIWINAPAEICFDLARSVQAHESSTAHTYERAIAGKVEGLMELGDCVTWRAKHLGVWQTLTAQITHFERPHCFVDEMVQGTFQRFHHTHHFSPQDGGTLMVDTFDYTSPLGVLGTLADKLFLEKYMHHFLLTRNRALKAKAEAIKAP